MTMKDATFPPAPTVGQANASLRAKALDTAWWLRHWATNMPDMLPSQATSRRQSMLAMADSLDAAVKASNDALDREAFGGPVHRESRA